MMTGLQDINWVELFGKIYMKLLLNERWNHLDILILKNLTRSKQVKYALTETISLKLLGLSYLCQILKVNTSDYVDEMPLWLQIAEVCYIQYYTDFSMSSVYWFNGRTR